MKKNRFLSVWAAACLLSLLASCGKGDKQAMGQVAAVTVKEMTIGQDASYANDYKYSGTVEEEKGTQLSFSVNGTISQLKVKVGDPVRKGQLIASVDPTSVRNSYEISHANRQQAEDAYKRYKQLYDKGSLPEIKWVEVQSKLQESVSAENIAWKNLSDCNLYAPYDGIISEKNMEVGQNAVPGMPVVKLVTTQVLNVKVAIPESEISNVAIRQEAFVGVQALGGKTFRGHVVEKSVIADPASRSYSVKIKIDGASKDLLPGMVSEVRFAGKSSLQAIIVPAYLIQLGDDGSSFVWLDEGGKAVLRTITLGEYQSNGVVVTSGLKYGNRLIVEGQQKVCNGSLLKVKR